MTERERLMLLYSELAQQNVDVLGAGVNNSDDKQDKVDTAVLGVVKHNV